MCKLQSSRRALFPPSFLLNRGDIITRNVVYACKAWKNKRIQWYPAWDIAFKIQRISAASETNERKTDCHQIFIFPPKVWCIFLWGIVCKWYIKYVKYNCKQTRNLPRLQSVPWSLFTLQKKRQGMPFGTGLGYNKSHIELLELTLLIFLIFYGFLVILCIPYL